MSLRVAAFEAVGGNCSTLLLSGQVMEIVRLTSCLGASSISLAKCFATTGDLCNYLHKNKITNKILQAI